ncbi:MAG: hypothetical protein ABIN91_22080 [Mucilaginibacter sp.]|uniref:hypothetical protein n=1 Tax=Mucilaginibacter sp. TaxID=1882438 RepID=UPI0032650287
MFSRLFKSTLFILLAFALGAHSSPVDLHHVVYVNHAVKHNNNTTTISKGSGQNNFTGLFAGENSGAHLTSQNYRLTHVTRDVVFFTQVIFASLNCSKYISRSSEVSFSRFRKLVLFPFHAFW